MKKTTKIVTIILLVVITGVVGTYAILMGRNMDERRVARQDARQDADMTAAEKFLNSRNLSANYPPTPREVIKYYNDIEKFFYADETTDEELEALGMRARELYDEELLENNKLPGYLVDLKADVQRFKDNGRKIVSVDVVSSLNVDIFPDDGYEFARLSCYYNIIDQGVTKKVGKVYLLRRDENRLWKIYGWDYEENVHIQE